jgi:predicted 3-demethylubiquinone-9 3-methyltransferase (glyoxalase superfamily)
MAGPIRLRLMRHRTAIRDNPTNNAQHITDRSRHPSARGMQHAPEDTLAGTLFIAFNMSGFTFTEAVSLQIPCADQAEADRPLSALTA